MEQVNWLKATIATIIGFIISYTEPHHSIWIAYGAALLCDMVWGIIYSWFWLKIKITTKKLYPFAGRIGMTLITYWCSERMAGTWDIIKLDPLFIPGVVIGAMSLVHFCSMLENLGRMGFPISKIIVKIIETRSEVLKDINNEIKK